jgi:flagellar biosynthesis/type III secretory pathway chaperone
MESNLLEAAPGRLKALLEREEQLYADLVSVCEKEQGAILRWCTGDLNACTREKEELTLEIGVVQKHREQVINELSEILGSGKSVSLPELADLLEDPFPGWLRAASSRFEAAAARLAELNEHNKRLLSDGLRVITSACELVRNASGFPSTYKPTGTICSSGESGRLLRGTA